MSNWMHGFSRLFRKSRCSFLLFFFLLRFRDRAVTCSGSASPHASPGTRPRPRKVRSVPLPPDGESCTSLPCSSFPRRTRLAGLRRGPRHGRSLCFYRFWKCFSARFSKNAPMPSFLSSVPQVTPNASASKAAAVYISVCIPIRMQRLDSCTAI